MSWSIVELGDLAEFRNGINYNQTNFGTGIKVIGVVNFQNYIKPRYNELEEVNPEGVVKDEDILRDNDILFVRSNGNKDLIGRSLFIESPPEPITFSGFCIRTRFTSNQVFPRFFAYLFRSDLIRKTLSAYGGGTNITNLNQKILSRLQVPLPPLATQQRIAEILSNYDRLIDNNNRRIALLEESIHQLYKEWFVRSRFPGYESVKIIDGIPEGWSKVTISDLYSTSSGGTPSRKKNDEYYMGGNIPWLKTQELNNRWIIDTEEKITESGLSNSSAKLFPKGTFIIAMYGATIGQFGILSKECTTNQACCALLYQSEYLFNYAYAFGYLLTEREKIISMGQGSAQPNISQQVIKKLDILKPSEVIIKYYNSIVEPWLDAMLSYQLMNIKLTEARDLLLPRLMNGSIAV